MTLWQVQARQGEGRLCANADFLELVQGLDNLGEVNNQILSPTTGYYFSGFIESYF